MAMGKVKLWHILLHLFSEIPWQALLHNKIIPNLLNLGSDKYIYIYIYLSPLLMVKPKK